MGDTQRLEIIIMDRLGKSEKRANVKQMKKEGLTDDSKK
jgi:hypothetical protein